MKYFHRNYFFLLIASALTTAPVSYTHLDVYKRQHTLSLFFHVLKVVQS